MGCKSIIGMRGGWVANGIFKWIVRTVCLLDGEGVSDAIALINLVVGKDDEYGAFSQDYCIAMCEDVIDHFDCKCECLGVSLLLALLCETPRITECFNLLGTITRLRSSYYSIILALFGTSSTALFGPSSHKEFRRRIESSMNRGCGSSSGSSSNSSSSSSSGDSDSDVDISGIGDGDDDLGGGNDNTITSAINGGIGIRKNTPTTTTTNSNNDDAIEDFDSAFEGVDTISLAKKMGEMSHNSNDNDSASTGVGSSSSTTTTTKGRIKVIRPNGNSSNDSNSGKGSAYGSHNNAIIISDEEDDDDEEEENLESFDDAFDDVAPGRASPLQLDFVRPNDTRKPAHRTTVITGGFGNASLAAPGARGGAGSIIGSGLRTSSGGLGPLGATGGNGGSGSGSGVVVGKGGGGGGRESAANGGGNEEGEEGTSVEKEDKSLSSSAQLKAKMVGKVVIPRLAISAISNTGGGETVEQVLESTTKKTRHSITLTLPEYDVNKSRETARTALENAGLKLGQVFPVADLPIMLEYKKHLEKMGRWSGSGSTGAEREELEMASSFADGSYSLCNRIVVEDNRTHSKQNQTRVNFLRAFRLLTQPMVGVTQSNSLVPLLYTDMAMSYSDKSFRYDEGYKRAVWGVLNNLAASVDMTFGMGWAQETDGLREGSREIMGVRRKLDGLLYHLNLRMANLLKPPVNIVSILAHIHILADYLERCSNKSMVMEVLYDCLENIVGLKDFFVKLKGNSPLEYEFSYCVVFVFRKLISQSCSIAVTVYLLKSFFMDHDAWERTKDMATQLFLNAKVIKDISALPNGEKLLVTYRINIVRYFSACANAMKTLCVEAAAARKETSPLTNQQFTFGSSAQLEKTFAMMMFKFDFILNPKDGFMLRFLEKVDDLDPAIRIELLDFLSCLLSTQFAPFHNIDSYVDAYINHTYVNFLKYYQIKDKTPTQEELCESYLLILIDSAKSRSKKVCDKLFDLKVLNFMVHEIQLEYEIACEWSKFEDGSSDKFFAQVKHTTPSKGVITLLNVPPSPKVPLIVQAHPPHSLLLPGLPTTTTGSSTTPTPPSASPSPSTAGLKKSGRVTNTHIPKLALVRTTSGIFKHPPPKPEGINLNKTRSRSFSSELKKSAESGKGASAATNSNNNNNSNDNSCESGSTASATPEPKQHTPPPPPPPLHGAAAVSSSADTSAGKAISTSETLPQAREKSKLKRSHSNSKSNSNSNSRSRSRSRSSVRNSDSRKARKKGGKVVIPKLALTKELSERAYAGKDEEYDNNEDKKKDGDDGKGKVGHMSAIQRTFEKTNKMQLQFDNHFSEMKQQPRVSPKQQNSSAVMLEKKYMRLREERYVYSNDYIHASVLTYIISNIFNMSDTLDDRYFDQFPLQNKKMNIPFILSKHINHPANKDIVAPLMIEARNVGRSAVVFMKLISRSLFNPAMYHDLKKIGSGAYGTVYHCNIRTLKPLPSEVTIDTLSSATAATTSSPNSVGPTRTKSPPPSVVTPPPPPSSLASSGGGSGSSGSGSGGGTAPAANVTGGGNGGGSFTPEGTPDIEVFSETKTLVVKQMPVSQSIHDRCVLHDSFTEILTLDMLKNDHRICRMYDFGVDNENYWIVMKAYKTSLRKWRIQRRGDTLHDMLPLYLNVFSDVLGVCMLLLENRVNHYDIKCDNFFIHPLSDTVSEHDFWMPPTPEPTFAAYLGDFGEALIYTTDDEGYTTRNKGTEYIKSPEMLQVAYCTQKSRATYDRLKKAGCNSASDVWSIGCLFYELLTGDYLFFDEDWVCFYMRVTSRDSVLLTKENRRKLGDNKYIISFLEAVLIRDQFRRPTLPEVIQLFNTLKPLMLKEAGADPSRPIHYAAASATAPVPPPLSLSLSSLSLPASVSASASPQLQSGELKAYSEDEKDKDDDGNSSSSSNSNNNNNNNNNNNKGGSGSSANSKSIISGSHGALALDLPEEIIDLNAVIPQESFEDILRESKIISRLPVEITPHLALGSVGCFAYPECLIQRCRITHIIDMSGDPSYEHLNSRFTVMKVNPHLIKGYQIIPTINQCVGFIRSALMRNGRILIASQSGAIIAAGVSIGCLMIFRIMDIIEAISLVRSMYPPTKLHPVFKSQLFRIAQEISLLLGTTPLELTHRFLLPRTHFRCFCGNSMIHLRSPVPDHDCETVISCTCDCSESQGPCPCPNTGAGCGRFIAAMNKKYGFDQSALRWALVSESSVCGGIRKIMQSSVIVPQFKDVPLAQRKSPKPWNMYCCKLCGFITFSEYIRPMKNGEKLIAVLINIDAKTYGFNGGLSTSITPYYKELHSSRPIQIIHKNTFLGKKSLLLTQYIN